MRKLLLFFIALATWATAWSQEVGDILFEMYRRQPTVIHLKGVNVITMDSNKVLVNQNVFIKQGKIWYVGPSKGPTAIPKSALVIDATGKYLIPGLIDCHAHFYDVSDTWLFLSQGVTTLRNMSGDAYAIEQRNAIRTNKMIGPQVLVASPIIDNSNLSDFYPIKNTSDAALIVQECKGAGFDFLKIGHHLSPEMYAAIGQKCKVVKIPLVGHPPENMTVKDLVENGQVTAEHLLLLNIKSGKDIEDYAKSKIWICPTLSVYSEDPVSKRDAKTNENFKYLYPALLKQWTKYPREYVGDKSKLRVVYDLWKQGANIIAGTDCRVDWVVPAFSIHDELGLMVKQGIPAFDALKTATINASRCLLPGDKNGMIKQGYNADLVLLSANPLDDIGNTKKIEAVINNGMWFGRAELDNIMAELAKERK